MLDASLAARYANALFSTTQAQGVTAGVLEELGSLITALSGDRQLRKFFNHPAIPSVDKKQLLDDVVGKSFSPISRRFLAILLDAKRMIYLSLIYETVKELFNRYHNKVSACVASVFPLDAALQKSVKERIEKYLGKSVDLEFAVDSALLGGVKLTIEDEVIDGSVLHNLKKLETKIALG